MRRFISFLKLAMVPAIWLSGVREIYAVIVRSSFGIIAVAFARGLRFSTRNVVPSSASSACRAKTHSFGCNCCVAAVKVNLG